MDVVVGDNRHDEAGDERGGQRLEEEDGGDGEGDTPAGWPGMLGGRGAHFCLLIVVVVVLLCCCLLLLLRFFCMQSCAEKSSAENCAEKSCRPLAQKATRAARWMDGVRLSVGREVEGRFELKGCFSLASRVNDLCACC